MIIFICYFGYPRCRFTLALGSRSPFAHAMRAKKGTTHAALHKISSVGIAKKITKTNDLKFRQFFAVASQSEIESGIKYLV
jgi:hypothetical protein